jgi:rSAM/selenodomain-associated transferase 2
MQKIELKNNREKSGINCLNEKIYFKAKINISVIVPTFNAKKYIGACIDSINLSDDFYEIIVVDGGSTDLTRSIALSKGVKVINSKKGRGWQFNAGVKEAKGNVYFFLHADSILSPKTYRCLVEAFIVNEVKVAKLTLEFDKKKWLLSLYSRLARFDSFWTSFGDQGFAVRKDFYNILGGYPLWTLLEDVNILQRCRKLTKIYTLPTKIITSAEKFTRNGFFYQQIFNAYILIKYLIGCSPTKLSLEYDKR